MPIVFTQSYKSDYWFSLAGDEWALRVLETLYECAEEN